MDQRVNGSLVLIGSNAGTISVQAQPNGGNLTVQLPNTLPSIGQVISVTNVLSNNVIVTGWGQLDFGNIDGTIVPTQLSPGTYGISISGNAASATFAATAETVSGTVPYSHISDPPPLPQTFVPVLLGSPPEPFEFLTGYDASTGEFSASSLLSNLFVTSVFGRTGAVLPLASDYNTFYDPLGAAATAQINAEAFATTAVAAETSRAETAEALLQPLSQRGQANGYASLNANGQVPTAQLPAVTVNQTFVVNSEAEMLALPNVVGEIAVRTDISETFILQSLPADEVSGSPATPTNWVQLLSSASVISVNGYTGVVDLAFSDLSTHPTTLAGYGITDALSNTTVLPITVVRLPNEFLTSYSSTTGLFTQAALQVNDIPSLLSLYDATGAATTAQANAEAFTTAALADYAPLASPTFTGIPTAPTAAALTSDTQIATTAYVDAAVAAGGGTSKLQTARYPASPSTITLVTAQVAGPFLINFTTPYADNNYTYNVTVNDIPVAAGDAAPQTVTIAAFPSIGVFFTQKQTTGFNGGTTGAGVVVWIANHDSGTHYVDIQVMAWHD